LLVLPACSAGCFPLLNVGIHPSSFFMFILFSLSIHSLGELSQATYTAFFITSYALYYKYCVPSVGKTCPHNNVLSLLRTWDSLGEKNVIFCIILVYQNSFASTNHQPHSDLCKWNQLYQWFCSTT
jgi:hypothetical protein